MELREGYKQTEVGVIPEDWDIITASDACKKIQDGTHFSPKLGGNDFFYITSKNIRTGFLDLSTAERIDTKQHKSIYKRCDVKKGDILLTKDGANTGNATLNNLEDEFSLLSSVAFLRLDEQSYDSEYFLQQIICSEGQKQIQDAMSGNAITRLTLEKINKLIFPLPPTKTEQTAIANALSDADAWIQSLTRLIAKKRQIKQGAMQTLLNPYENGRLKAGWVVKKLGDVCQPSSKRIDPRTEKDNYKCVELEHIAQEIGIILGFVDSRIQLSHKAVFKKNDVLFSKLRPYLKKYFYAEFDGVCSTEIWVLKSDKNIHSRWLYYLIQSESIIEAANQSTGTKMPRAEWRVVKKTKVGIPTNKNEQTRIATILSDIDNEITALESKLAKAQKIKQGMMQNLLTGRIRLL